MPIAEYAVMLDSLAEFNYENANDEIALLIGKKALYINQVVYGKNSSNYAKSLSLQAKCLYEQAHYTESLELINKALTIQENSRGKDNLDYADYLTILADNYSDLGEFKQAIEIGEEALSIIEMIEGKSSVSYAKIAGSLANYYYEYEKITKSNQLCEHASHIYEKEHLDNTAEYATIISVWAKCKSRKGYDKEAIVMGNKALAIFKELYGSNHPSYAALLETIGVFYSNMGYYSEAIRFNTEATNIYKDVYKEDHPVFIILYNNLISYFFESDRFREAIQCGHKTLNIMNNANIDDYLRQIYIRKYLADSYRSIGNNDEALNQENAILSIFENNIEDYYDYALISTIADCYSDMGDNQKAIVYGKEALRLLMEISSENDFLTAHLLDNISHYYSEIGLCQEANLYVEKASERFRRYCLRNFFNMSNYQRYNIGIILQQRFKNHLGFAYRCNLPQITSVIYDYYTLFAKGILLNTEINIKELIEENGDSILMNSYYEYVSNKDIFNKLISHPSSERYINLDSLNNILQQQEENFAKKVLKDNDILQMMNITWKDVQSSLQEDEIAVEFVDIPLKNDSVIYAALTIKSEYDKPKMTPLFEYKQLECIPDTLYYQCRNMTNLVWKPLYSELQNVKNIYFSSSGVLYNIGVEFLPGMEEYNIFRLSSTRELVKGKRSGTSKYAVLYGGLDYYARLDTITNKLAIPNDTFIEHVDVRGMNIRGGKGYLKYTMDEIIQIEKEFSKALWSCMLDTLSNGTEESFKSLSKKGVGCLHIATHGFYYTNDEVNDAGYHFLQLDDRIASEEDKSLTRSGLIMSGANHILEGEDLPDNVEDGILTAKEISDVDLRGLDLVVLSACQSGLGDVSQGDGVFGLQRGFKKAGANSILMSLWEVDDKATQILMTQFYKNWLSGQSKHQSLLSAQKYLRETEGGKYNKPKYWAAFILLDGLT